jgi:hypothetical protein
MGCYLQRYLDENVYQYQKTDSFLDSVNIYAIDRIQGKPNRYYINNVQVDAPTISYNDPLDTSNAILFQNGGASSNGKIEISWVRVRKTAEVEPCLLFDFYYSWEHQNNVIVVLDNDIAENYYQGKVELSFLEGMNTDGSDIRFTDQFGNPLPYWIESFEDNVFTIWILFSTDNNYLYYHYGNPDAVSESSGSDVFDFFDDFSAVDTNKWTYSGATHYSYSNSTIQLNGTGNPSYILSKSTFENNSIIECKAYHPTPNSGFAGMYGAANNFSVWRFDGDAATNEMQMTYNPSGSQYLVDTRHRIANQYTIYGIELSGTVNKFYINGYLRDTMSSYCPTYPLYIYLSSSYNEGTVVYDWVRIRYHLSTEPRLRPLYDLSKLDPESIDINKSVDSAYTQLTAKFPHSNIPKKGSRIIYKVTGSDVTDLVMFYGFVSSINPTFGYLENSSTLIAFDDMSSLAQKRMPQYCSNNITYTADTNSHLLNYISHDLVGTEIFEGNIENLVMPDIANITMEFDTTSYEHLKKMMFMYGNYMKSRFALRPGAVPLNTSKEYRERLDSMSAYYMDFPDGAMYINASFTLTYPDLNLMSSPSIKYENSDGYNKVTVHGVLSNTKTKVYSSVVSKEVYEGTEPVNEYVYEDNFIYEKGSTATKEAVKWLLYFKTKRAKVNLKFVDRFKFDLYQRFKFSGFPDEFDNLTDNKQMETVYTYDPSADPVELNPWTYTKIDVSGVPTPKWMRITGIKYHKAFLDEYVELEGITDWIQSYIDEAVSAP